MHKNDRHMQHVTHSWNSARVQAEDGVAMLSAKRMKVDDSCDEEETSERKFYDTAYMQVWQSGEAQKFAG